MYILSASWEENVARLDLSPWARAEERERDVPATVATVKNQNQKPKQKQKQNWMEQNSTE